MNIDKMTMQLNKLKGQRLLKSEFKEALRKIYANTYFYRAIRESGFVVEDNDNNAYFITQSEPIYKGKVELLYKQAYNCSRDNYIRYQNAERPLKDVLKELAPKEKSKTQQDEVVEEFAAMSEKFKSDKEAEAIKFLKSRGYLIYKSC
jgi:hypothetical protein